MNTSFLLFLHPNKLNSHNIPSICLGVFVHPTAGLLGKIKKALLISKPFCLVVKVELRFFL